jgi:hypothetical protein
MTYPTIMPALSLDFQNSQQLDPRVTFSRSSGATYINSAGLVVSAADNEARFDHDPVTGECLGLLIEESRTNYIPNSIDFTGWSQVSGASIALSSAVAAPDGNTSSSLFTADDSSGYVALPYTIPGDTTAYLTLFVKAASENVFQLSSSRSTTMRGLFDMTTGLWSSTAGSADDYAAEAYPNGWWKLTVKGFIAGPSTIVLYVVGPNITSAGTDAFYMWGAQVEHGSFPTSLIPTSGSTVTRAADVAQITGDNFSSWYNQGEGSFIVTSDKVDALPDLQFTVMTTDGYRLPEFTFRSNSRGTVYTPIIGSYTSLSPVVRATFGAAFDGTGMSSYINGAGNSVANTNIVDTNTTLYLGNYINSASYLLTGHISRLTYYNERLTDTELQTLTL